MKYQPALSPTEQLMLLQEQMANAVASMTGMKAQFIAAGWSEPNAELATIEAIRQSGGNK